MHCNEQQVCSKLGTRWNGLLSPLLFQSWAKSFKKFMEEAQIHTAVIVEGLLIFQHQVSQQGVVVAKSPSPLWHWLHSTAFPSVPSSPLILPLLLYGLYMVWWCLLEGCRQHCMDSKQGRTDLIYNAHQKCSSHKMEIPYPKSSPRMQFEG